MADQVERAVGREMFGDLDNPTAMPAVRGVNLAAQASFRAPDGVVLWIAAADDAKAEGAVCNLNEDERLEISLIDVIEDIMSGCSKEERDAEAHELAEHLRYLAGWIERGGRARW